MEAGDATEDMTTRNMPLQVPPISVDAARRVITYWDAVAILLVLAFIVFLAEASRDLGQPLADLEMTPISLDPWNLPEYAARTTLRMLAALVLSLVFTLTYATGPPKVAVPR